MRENKSLIVYKESFFVKLKNFFKNIFDKKNSKEIHHELAENEIHVEHSANSKNKFKDYISFKENKEEIQLINKVRDNTELLWAMTDEELDRVEEAIQDRQKYVERKTSKLKTDLMMKKTAKI